MIDDIQAAAIKRALATLDRDPDYHHSSALIERIAGKQAVKEVAALKSEYVEANKAALSNGGAMLSGEAADYWQEAQATLAYGRMVHANPSRGRELALSRKCEDLLASFDNRVPLAEQGKFRRYVDGDASNWDDRWHNTVDGFFPLLESHFVGSMPVKNPAAEAQRVVLSGLIASEPDEALQPSRNVSRLRSMLAKLSDDYSAALAKLKAKAAADAAAARKREEAEKKKAERAAKIASGDQKATKKKRGAQLKIVTGLFDEGKPQKPV